MKSGRTLYSFDFTHFPSRQMKPFGSKLLYRRRPLAAMASGFTGWKGGARCAWDAGADALN
jgi:hypothetical protein